MCPAEPHSHVPAVQGAVPPACVVWGALQRCDVERSRVSLTPSFIIIRDDVLLISSSSKGESESLFCLRRDRDKALTARERRKKEGKNTVRDEEKKSKRFMMPFIKREDVCVCAGWQIFAIKLQGATERQILNRHIRAAGKLTRMPHNYIYYTALGNSWFWLVSHSIQWSDGFLFSGVHENTLNKTVHPNDWNGCYFHGLALSHLIYINTTAPSSVWDIDPNGLQYKIYWNVKVFFL